MPDKAMPVIGHLTELRKRLIVSFAALFAGFLIAFSFSEDLMGVLTIPMRMDISFRPSYPFLQMTERAGAMKLVFLAPAEAFWMHMKVSLIAGLFLSLPVILYQLWGFVSPGLLPGEKKYAGLFVVVATLLFLAGAAFCLGVVLPFAIRFLLTYKTSAFTPMISVGNYADFCLKFLLAFGAIFELPVAILFLTRMGVVSPATLARHRKYAVLLAFVAAAILTPTPDAFNQTLMAVPIIILYEAGILVSRIFSRRRS